MLVDPVHPEPLPRGRCSRRAEGKAEAGSRRGNDAAGRRGSASAAPRASSWSPVVGSVDGCGDRTVVGAAGWTNVDAVIRRRSAATGLIGVGRRGRPPDLASGSWPARIASAPWTGRCGGRSNQCTADTVGASSRTLTRGGGCADCLGAARSGTGTAGIGRRDRTAACCASLAGGHG